MKILVFDTETTGLPHDSSMSATQSPNNWPHIVSISWAVLDSVSNTVMKSHCYIVKPEKWTIPEESSRIHGITQAQALEFGLPLRYVMDQFIGEQYDTMVAHNLNFDLNVIMNAIVWDLKIQFPGFKKAKGCTMMIGKLMCKIPGRYGYGYKYPKLKELYQHVIGRSPKTEQLHNALFDTLYLCEIIQVSSEIRIQLGIIPPSLKHEDHGMQPQIPKATSNERNEGR